MRNTTRWRPVCYTSPALERGRCYPALDSSYFRNVPPSDTEVNRGVAIYSGRPPDQLGNLADGSKAKACIHLQLNAALRVGTTFMTPKMHLPFNKGAER